MLIHIFIVLLLYKLYLYTYFVLGWQCSQPLDRGRLKTRFYIAF